MRTHVIRLIYKVYIYMYGLLGYPPGKGILYYSPGCHGFSATLPGCCVIIKNLCVAPAISGARAANIWHKRGQNLAEAALRSRIADPHAVQSGSDSESCMRSLVKLNKLLFHGFGTKEFL